MINYGLFGFNTVDVNGTATNKLFSIYGNDLVNVDTGLGYKLNIPPSSFTGTVIDRKFSMISFLNRCFLFSNVIAPVSYNGTNWLRDFTPVYATPWATIAKPFRERIYLADAILLQSSTFDNNKTRYYKNRVFYTDLPVNDKISWGISIIHSDGPVEIIGKDIVACLQQRNGAPYFKGNGIKVGDPIFILSYNDTPSIVGQWTVKEIIDEYKLRTVENFPQIDSDFDFWVGSNWFDVNDDNNDEIKALEENNNRLMIFKQDSLFRYDTTSLVRVKNVPGTSSKDSVINIGDYTIYFHGSTKSKTGFYLYDGVTSQRISNAIQPFVDGILASNYPNVVAWREGNIYRAYVGNISNTNSSNSAYNISRTNAIFSYNVSGNEWKIDSCNHVIKAATTMRENNEEKIFFQDDSGKVFQTPSGNSFGGVDIPFKLELQPYYPRGVEVINNFTRIKVVGRDCRGVTVMYKLWNTPFSVDDEYRGLGDLENDVTELSIPINHANAAGIQLMFQEIGQSEPNFTIEKISIYSTRDTIYSPEKKEQS